MHSINHLMHSINYLMHSINHLMHSINHLMHSINYLMIPFDTFDKLFDKLIGKVALRHNVYCVCATPHPL